MTNTNTTTKITKRMNLNALLALEAVQANPNLVAYCENELALLDKKNASNTKRKSPNAEANEALKEAILDYLADANGLGYTVAELIKAVPELDGLSTSKVSAILRMLIAENAVERYEEKRKAYFKRVEA